MTKVNMATSVRVMARHVSPDRKQDVFKLPGISVNNRVANPPAGAANGRRADRSPDHGKPHSLPPARPNGYLTTSDHPVQAGMTAYSPDAGVRGDQAHARRQQSLPSRKPAARGRQRQANSAPSRKDRAHNSGVSLPNLNGLVARSRGPAGDTSHIVTTNFAGYSTKDHAKSHHKSTKFASTWAQVRAENHIDMCSPSPEGTAKRAGQEDDTPANDKAMSRKHRQGPSPERESTKKDNSRGKNDYHFHAVLRDKENVKPDSQKKDTPSPDQGTQATKKKSREGKPKQSIRFAVPPKDEQHDNDDLEGGQNRQQPQPQRVRPAWNNSLAVDPPQQTPPSVAAPSWRRYEAELTHTPAITSSKQVYRAYTGRFRQQHQGALRDDDLDERPSTKGSADGADLDEEDEMDDSAAGPNKEYVLTKKEAEMYLHLQNVYGSEAYRQQRKEWFFKKLTDVQLQELQQQAAERRRKQARREESRKRQYRQLANVRRKFRKEQMHRFRTQYVTSRVLEYEREDRDLYGLPGDFEPDDVSKGGSGQGKQYQGHADTESPSDSRTRTQVAADRVNSHAGGQAGSSDAGRDGERGPRVEKSQAPGAEPRKPATKDRSEPSGSLTSATKASSSKAVRSSDTGRLDSQSKSQQTKDSARESDQPSYSTDTGRSGLAGDTSKPSAAKTDVTTGAGTASSQGLDAASASSSTQGKGGAGAGEKTTVTTTPPSTVAAAGTTPPSPPSSQGKAGDSDVSGKTKHPTPTTTTDADSSDKSAAADARARTTSNSLSFKGPARSSPNAKTENATADSRPVQNAKTDTKSSDVRSIQNAKSESKAGDVRSVQNRKTESEEDSVRAVPNTETGNITEEHRPADSERKDKKSTGQHKGAGTGTHNTEGAEDQGKRTTVTKDAKGRYITTTKNYGYDDTHVGSPANEAISKDSHHPSAVKDSQNTTLTAAPTNPSSSPQGPKGPDNRPKPPSRQKDKSQGRRQRAAAASQPKGEAEQRRQLERKYGKMFEQSSGPSWNPGAKAPKMEGIDTVVVRVTDDKGRTRLKKREVKDVVKEAKAQLAASDADTHRSSGGKTTQKSLQPPPDIRPASADTLDFDDDEEDEEDIFERVRRKYNLQIDSDDDDV